MTMNDGLTVTDPNGDGDLWIECACGGCGYLSRGPIIHRRRCGTRAQYTAPTAAVAVAPLAATGSSDELRAFADSVRRTGLTHGRDADVREAVRRGYLSVSAAMNTDD